MQTQTSENTDFRKLTSRNTLLTIILFISPFFLLYLAINHEISSQIKTQINNRLAQTVDENIKTVSIFLQDRETDLRSFSHFDIKDLGDIPRITPVLASRLADMRWYDFILVADLEGRIVLSLNIELSGSIGDREYFRAAREGRFFNSGIFFSEIVGSSVMILSVPLRNRHDELVGVMAAGLDLPRYYGLLFDLRIGETSELFLTDGQGTLLSPTKLGGRLLVDKGFMETEGNPHKGERGVKTHTDYRGQQVLCAYARIPGSTDYLVSEIDLKEALIPLRQVNRIILMLFLPFFLVLVLISTLNSRRTTSLLRRLTTDLRLALAETRKKKGEVDKINIELQKRAKESELLAEELRLSEEYITSLLDSISLGVVGLDSSGRITHFNREIRQLFNLPDIKKGENIFQALPWLNDKDIELAFDNTILGGRPNRVEKKADRQAARRGIFHPLFFPGRGCPRKNRGGEHLDRGHHRAGKTPSPVGRL